MIVVLASDGLDEDWVRRAQAGDGKLVQVKATQDRSVALRAQPDHLLMLRLQQDGIFEEIYNGPGTLAWQHIGKRQKNGQYPISVRRLQRLMPDVPLERRLPRVEEPERQDEFGHSS